MRLRAGKPAKGGFRLLPRQHAMAYKSTFETGFSTGIVAEFRVIPVRTRHWTKRLCSGAMVYGLP
jgi:hypothetical protein